MFNKEKDMQDWLSDKLKNSEGITEFLDDYESFGTPETQEERRIIESYEHCVKSLHLIEVISEDENISLKSGDILRPDFLAYAPESESIVIIELKNINGPTRQVGTELGAYTSEVKSYVPFISDGDIVNVVVSRYWPTLLRHYLFNEIYWHQRNIICLQPYISNGGSVRLKPYAPKNLIEDNISSKISERHLGGIQLCLYDDELYSGGSRDRLDKYIEQIKTSTASLAIKGNAQKSHGFAFLWKDFRKNSITPYNITIVNLAPFRSLERLVKDENNNPVKISNLTDRFIKITTEFDPIGHGQSLDQLFKHCEPFLTPICTPRLEGFMEWSDLKRIMVENSELLAFSSWGVFSELLSNKISEEYNKGKSDISLTDPNIGLQVINDMIDPEYQYVDLSYYYP